jgi:bifunctional ADP-heptose synthase (sugar kinase/adenylyltransferase)
MSEAAWLANEAAGLSVARFGPATVSLMELLKTVEASATT